MKNTLIITFFFTVCISCQQLDNQDVSIIPRPQHCELRMGSFTIDSTTSIAVFGDDSRYAEQVKLFEEWLGLEFRYSYSERPFPQKNQILLIPVPDWADEDEGKYELRVDRFGVKLLFGTDAGLVYGMQSIRQLCLTQVNLPKKYSIPCVSISDEPSYSWRGLMLDCSRTFLPIPYLKKQIDLMSFYKMNVLHLHLTDDQGWRIEIKKYPELTEKCSESAGKYTDQHGGYYTQHELVDLVAYASLRQVTLVPEIEMPGHSSEIFAAYPDLSCTGERSEIFPFFSGPGITNHILCAGQEDVFAFLADVIDEVIEIFPSEYIHIGGDEAPKIQWKNCEACQARIRQEGLKDESELQSYFISRIAKHIHSKGRKMIGWDEILEGGLAEGAAVMSWRGIEGGVAAARMGHPVVMSPTSHCYIDYSHSSISTEKVYSFDPLPKELSSKERDMVLGGQVNLWTHIDRDMVSLDRQIYPRLIALSEALWSDGDHRSWADFEKRMGMHYPVLDKLKTSYFHQDLVYYAEDSLDPLNRIRAERYKFDFHGFKGFGFNLSGMKCKIVAPDLTTEGKPFIWRARFWGHEPQTDSVLLSMGFHVVYCDVADLYGNSEALRRWDVFYQYLQSLGFAEKAVLEGMSRGGLISYNWAAANPDKVSCIYADAPVLDGRSWPGGFWKGKGSQADWHRLLKAYEIEQDTSSKVFMASPIAKTHQIALAGIPLLHVVGLADKVVPSSENTDPFEKGIMENGGIIEVIRKPGVGHHPHSLKDPEPIVTFILQHSSN